MGNSVFFAIGFILMLIAGSAAYAWRKRANTHLRLPGGIALFVAPLCLQIAFIIIAALPGVVLWLNAKSPVSDVTIFERAWLLSFFWTPFWSVGALGGHMLRSIIERPLRV